MYADGRKPLSPEEKKKIEEIVARDKPGYVVDWSQEDLPTPVNVDRSAPDLEYLKRKFLKEDSLKQEAQTLIDTHYSGQKVLSASRDESGLLHARVDMGAAGIKVIIFKDGKPFAAQG